MLEYRISNKRGKKSKNKQFTKKYLSKKRDSNQLIEIDPRMDYTSAIGMIHNHIMSLEI